MEATYKFGPYKIDAREVFHATPLSYAMVNLRPLLPGNIPHSLSTSPLPMLLLG
jgi:bis(5'-adenosyl)-triphosphatase